MKLDRIYFLLAQVFCYSAGANAYHWLGSMSAGFTIGSALFVIVITARMCITKEGK